jgi:hypothetical protein
MTDNNDNNDQIIDTISFSLPTYPEKSNVMDLIKERLAFGRQKYGHGVQIDTANLNDYNNNWTDSIKQMDWASMMLEEAIDGMVYSAAEIIRVGKDNTHLKCALNHMNEGAISMLRYKASISS